MKLKTISYAALALALTAGSALAADLPSRKGPPAYLPPPPPPPLWTGFYVGLNAGGTFGGSSGSTTDAWGLIPAPPAGSPIHSWVAGLSASTIGGNSNNGGFIGGGQIGYNWQFGNSFVASVEADIQGVASSGGNGQTTFGVANDPVTATNFVTLSNHSKRLDYLGTVRGRLGWLFTPTLLLYGTGGLAYGGVQTNNTFVTAELGVNAGFGGSAFADTRVGWTAGGGLEWMFWPNWSAKVEYLYYDLGTVRSSAVVVAPALDWGYVANTRTRFDGHVVRAGVNYHFNWGTAPVMAKY